MPTDFSQLPQMVESLTTVATVLERLGVPGLLALMIAGPAAVIVALIFINHTNTKTLTAMHEQARRDMQDMSSKARAESATILAAYREDTLKIVRELGENQRETAQYYKDNVELVKMCQRTADDLSDIIVSNTAAWQRVVANMDNNMYCPAARESARGKK